MSRLNNGHPYGRLSSDPQAKGHGERRQKAADFQGFCDHFGFVLSEKVWFDKGVSAYDESNWDDDAELGRFVREARRGVRVRRGDVLIVEDWDRLARLPWTRLVIRIAELFEAGIHLGDATRTRLIRYDSEDPSDAVDLIFGTSRGHGESKRKSGMVQKAKDDRRSDAAAGRAILTQSLPHWIHIVPCAEDDPDAHWYGSVKKRKWGKLALREPQSGIIRDVAALRKEGLGPQRIVKEMMRRGVPNPAGNRWRAEKVSALLRDRRLIGELPPARFKASNHRLGKGKLEHPAVPGYYPPVLSESEFYALQASNRRGPARRGRDGAMPNPFKGMILDALSGQTYYVIWKPQRDGTKGPKLLNDDGVNGGGRLRSFDYTAFEDAVCTKLYEINPADIVGESDAGRDTAALAGQLADCEQRRGAFKASMRGKTMTPLLADEAIALDQEYERLKEELSEAQARAEQPLSEAWGEQQSLLLTMKNAADPVAVRERLRERLRQTVRQIWLLVVPVGRERMAAVQIDFHGSDHKRHYIIRFRQAVKTQNFSRPAQWCYDSWPSDGPWKGFDLASREDAAVFSAALAAVPPSLRFPTREET
jgi:hypothetical protein